MCFGAVIVSEVQIPSSKSQMNYIFAGFFETKFEQPMKLRYNQNLNIETTEAAAK